MSTQKSNQPTLEDYLVDQHAESQPETDADSVEIMKGARYGRDGTPERDAKPDDAGCCQNCGRDLVEDPNVERDVLRVVGDNHLRVPVCNLAECRTDYFGGGESSVKDADLVRTVDRARYEVTPQ